jgi:hypothetical protein
VNGFHQVGSQRVALDIPQRRPQVIVLLDGERLEAALEQRPGSRRAMRRVPTLGVSDRPPSHELRQIAVATRPKHEMPMIGHYAPRQNPHRQSLFGLSDHLLERLEVPPLAENPQPAHRSIEHVVDVSAAGNPQSSWHAR